MPAGDSWLAARPRCQAARGQRGKGLPALGGAPRAAPRPAARGRGGRSWKNFLILLTPRAFCSCVMRSGEVFLKTFSCSYLKPFWRPSCCAEARCSPQKRAGKNAAAPGHGGENWEAKIHLPLEVCSEMLSPSVRVLFHKDLAPCPQRLDLGTELKGSH